MANRYSSMGFMMSAEGSQFVSRARPTPSHITTSTVERNGADDEVFAVMHRNKSNFSLEKVSAAFANVPRRKVG